MTEKIYSISELIEKFPLERSRIYTLIRTGKLKAFKKNGKLYMTQKEVDMKADMLTELSQTIQKKNSNTMIEVGLLEIKYKIERRQIYKLLNEGVFKYEFFNNKYFIYNESWEKNKHLLIGRKIKDVSDELGVDSRTLKKYIKENNIEVFELRLKDKDYHELKNFIDIHYTSGYIRDVFGISKIQLYRALESGLCEGVKKLGQWYIRKDTFDPNLIKNRRRR
ncbi:helix-turn-helix domain-containing protein (plasmid) [Mycoplasmatota bacterium]|nr:helix-turn-helix domain-containing protein [Mycoplasmatota bacterium]